VAIGGIDNAKIVSSIASIVISGLVSGSLVDPVEHFGFTAQKIGAFKALGVAQSLTAAVSGEVFELDDGDVTVREIPLPAPI
jgi:hypothetical protein